jgi:outer membrane protein assembly factor BamB
MSNGLRLSDDLIRIALTPPDDDAMAGLGQEIRELVTETRPRRYWWTPLRPILGPFGPPPALRVAALLVTLAALIALLAFAIAGSPRPSLLGDGTMFHGGAARTGEMAGPGPARGAEVAWTAPLGGPLSNGMPALAGDHLYVADGQGNVAVFDAATGAPGWTKKLPKPACSPAYSMGILVIGAGDGVYALEAVSGATRWHLPTGYPVASSPAVDQGNVYIGLPDGSLAAIDLQSGSVRWRTTIGGAVKRAPAVGDGLVFVGGDGGSFAAVRATDGAVVWRQPLGPGQVSTPAVRDGVVYVASGLDETAAPHMLSAFRASDGAPQWMFGAPSGAALYVAAIGPDLAYAVGLDGSINALSDGVVRWSHQTSGAIGSVATLSQGVLYVSVSDGTIKALDAGTGQLRWSVRVKGGPGPVIVDRGRLYVGTDLGQLVAFSETPASQAAGN